jgi:uncharacterized RDD family membrane protein YckC
VSAIARQAEVERTFARSASMQAPATTRIEPWAGPGVPSKIAGPACKNAKLTRSSALANLSSVLRRDPFGSLDGSGAKDPVGGRDAPVDATPAGSLAYDRYAPPTALATRPKAASGVLASRWRRLAGTCVDAPFEYAFQRGFAMALHGAGLDPFPWPPSRRPDASAPSPLLLVLCTLVPAAVQWTLIARSGQSLGKKAVGTIIVTMDGRTAGLVRGVLLRSVPLLVLAVVSVVLDTFFPDATYERIVRVAVSALIVLDPLFIFRSDRRCIHDHIAGTRVVRVGGASGRSETHASE